MYDISKRDVMYLMVYIQYRTIFIPKKNKKIKVYTINDHKEHRMEFTK